MVTQFCTAPLLEWRALARRELHVCIYIPISYTVHHVDTCSYLSSHGVSHIADVSHDLDMQAHLVHECMCT